MKTTPIKFTVNGVEIEVPSACVDYPLDRINANNPYWTRDALANIIRVINFKLPEAMGEALQEAVTNITNVMVAAPTTPDGIWLGNGPGLPAGAEGGADGAEVLGHINDYPGAGAAPTPFASTSAAPVGSDYVVATEDLRIDPVRHLAAAGISYVNVAHPFTCVAPIQYDAAAHEVEHGPVGATTLHEDTGRYWKGPRLADDGSGHIADPISPGDFGDLPTATVSTKLATAKDDYADPAGGASYCTVLALPEGEGANVTVRLYYKDGIEYPNVRTGNVISVFKDAGNNWCCTGPHDAPVGALDFNLNHSGGVPVDRPGWKICTELAGRFPRAYKPDVAAVGGSGGLETHSHLEGGAHAHTEQQALDVQCGKAYAYEGEGEIAVTLYPPALTEAQTTAVGLGATPEANHMPPWYGVAVLKRVNRAGEAGE